jgi:hypothetical protein
MSPFVSISLLTIRVLPRYVAPPIPTPPPTVNAPVVVLLEAVVPYIVRSNNFTIPVLILTVGVLLCVPSLGESHITPYIALEYELLLFLVPI